MIIILDSYGLIKSNSGVFALLVNLLLNKCERCYLNPGVHETSGLRQRPQKRWVRSGKVQIKYERNMDQRYLNNHRYPKKDRILKHTHLFSS